jgi:hypothetical protein
MKTLPSFNLSLMALIVAASALHVRANVPVYENKISLYGYVAGSVTQIWQGCLHGEPNVTDVKAAMDAAKIGLAFDYAPVSAKLSVYFPDTEAQINDSAHLLEANISYRMFNDSVITAGRFQSWIGYEAFDIPNRNFITPATTERLGIIPMFHEGVKYENRIGKYRYGLALLDAIYGTVENPYRGDGSLGDGYGVEGFGTYKGERLSYTVAVAYQNDRKNSSTDSWIFDLYGEYEIRRTKTTLGGEFCFGTSEPLVYAPSGMAMINNRTNTYHGQVMIKQRISDRDTVFLRVSAGHKKASVNNGQRQYDDGSPVHHGGTAVLFTKYSLAASHAVSKYMDVRAEVSYTDYTNTRQGIGQIAQESFAGLQLVLKF